MAKLTNSLQNAEKKKKHNMPVNWKQSVPLFNLTYTLNLVAYMHSFECVIFGKSLSLQKQ